MDFVFVKSEFKDLADAIKAYGNELEDIIEEYADCIHDVTERGFESGATHKALAEYYKSAKALKGKMDAITAVSTKKTNKLISDIESIDKFKF